MLGKTSWYSIDVSGNDRHILLFNNKCYFCHLLPVVKVVQNWHCPQWGVSLQPLLPLISPGLAYLIVLELPLVHRSLLYLVGLGLRSVHEDRDLRTSPWTLHKTEIKRCLFYILDLMHWRHHTAMLGVQAIALYALVICDWHISDNCVYA